MNDQLSGQAEFGEGDRVVQYLEDHFNGHADLDVGRVRVGDDQVAGHAGAFFQFNDHRHIGRFVAEGRSRAAVDDGKRVDDSLAATLGPVGIPGETFGADVSGIEVG